MMSEPVTTASTVTLGKLTATLREPTPTKALVLHAAFPTTPSPAAGEDDVDHGARLVVLAASVAACWPDEVRWPGKVHPGQVPLTRLRAFGEQVLDNLIQGGCDMQQIADAGIAAFRLVMVSIAARNEGVESAVGNSAAPPAT